MNRKVKNISNKVDKPNIDFDNKYFELGYDFLLGIDEVGRGALAGPVVSCGILVNKTDLTFLMSLNVNDSKKISKIQRENIYYLIENSNISYYISVVDNKTIDKINILQATLNSFKEITNYFHSFKCFILADGNKFFQDCQLPYETVVKGDSKSIVIATASIIAKVYRDKLMSDKLHNLYPVYNFAKHKGYATTEHIEKIKENGYSDIHRLTFLKKLNEKYNLNFSDVTGVKTQNVEHVIMNELF